MNKAFLISLLCCVVTIISCVKNPSIVNPVKNKPDSTEVKIKIAATGGADQTDTVGKALVDSVVVRINEPDSKLNKLLVRIFQKTLCNGDSVVERTIKNGGKVSYKWRLNSQPGVQTLNFKVLDSTLKVIDSIKVTATAIAPKPGWHVASCTVPMGSVTNLAMLSTGKLLVGYGGSTLPQYSDDNGISWHSFSYTSVTYTNRIITSPTDEIFIAANNNAVYYAPSFGAKWEYFYVGDSRVEWCIDIALLPGGQLIYTSMGGGIYIQNTRRGIFEQLRASQDFTSMDLHYAGMDANNNIYFIERYNLKIKLVKFNLRTHKLDDVTGLPVTASAFYIDANGAMFVGGANTGNNMVELYRSDNGGTTWSKIFDQPNTTVNYDLPLYNFTRQADGIYYFIANNDYYRSADLKTFTPMNLQVNGYSNRYIVAKNNYFITSSYPLPLKFLVR